MRKKKGKVPSRLVSLAAAGGARLLCVLLVLEAAVASASAASTAAVANDVEFSYFGPPETKPPVHLPQCHKHQRLVLGEACVVNGTVSADSPAVTTFSYVHSTYNTIVPRITAWSTANATGHAGFFLSQSCGFQQWSLPLSVKDCEYSLVRRDICPDVRCIANASNWQFSMTVTSLQQQLFIYKAELVDTALRVGEPKAISVSPNAPAYLRLQFGEHTQLRIDVRSHDPDPLRSIVSLQNSSCPVYDLASNVRFDGFYETALHTSTFVLDRSQLGPDIFVVILLLPRDHECAPVSQDFEVHVSRTDDYDYTWPIMFVIIIFLIVPYTLYAAVVYLEHRRGFGINEPEPEQLARLFGGVKPDHDDDDDAGRGHAGEMGERVPLVRDTARYGGAGEAGRPLRDMASSERGKGVWGQEPPSGSSGDNRSSRSGAEAVHGSGYGSGLLDPTTQGHVNGDRVEEGLRAQAGTGGGGYDDDGDGGAGAGAGAISAAGMPTGWDTGHNYTQHDLHICRGQERVYVNHLARKLPSVQEKKFKQYALYLIALMVFYALPVVQLVYSQLDHFHAGDQDLCYYNFRCSLPLWRMFSFNNIFSNLGYVTLGFLFLLIVRRRRRLLAEEASNLRLDTATCPDTGRGLPRHSGIFNAVGIAFVAEGVFSACYHTCPTPTNFQFDTSFMYVIGVLMALVLFQRRHNDVLPNPHVTYLWIAGLIFVVVVGVYWHTVYFYTIVLIVTLPLSFTATLQIYFLGMWGCIAPAEPLPDDIIALYFLDSLTAPRWPRFSLSLPRRKARAVLLLIINTITWVAVVTGLVLHFEDVPSFFLGLAIVNYLVYFTFYVFMKLRSGERLTRLPVVVFFLSLALWGAALYFFSDRASSFYLSPAESRDLNKDCILFGFYDTHDLWHMLSAYGLFLNAIVLLSLDDDVHATPRSSIPVF